MKKDKEWAKCIVRKELKAWQNVEGGIDEDGIKYILDIIDQLDEPEKVVVPKFVANLIKILKTDEELTSVSDALYYGAKDDEEEGVTDWRDENIDKFAQAWLDYPDIKIEEEPKYYVLDNEERPLLINTNGAVSKSITRFSICDERYSNIEDYQFTEQEIKDYDERYWAFAVPVEEVEDER